METDNEFDDTAVHDLIANDAFLQWVRRPTDALDAHWKEEVARRPQLESAVREARLLIQQLHFSEELPGMERKQQVFDRIRQQAGLGQPRKRKIPRWGWLQAVAVLTLVTVACVWLYTQYVGRPTNDLTGSLASAGRGEVVLSNGKILSLADLRPGTVVEEAGIRISLMETNHLVYQHGEGSREVRIERVVSPIGGLLHMELPDGSKVWLNSGSTLRLGGESNTGRRMDIDGQGYFEVMPHASLPFTVLFDNAEVTVLGTRFDVANYPHAPKVVTLLEGSVRVDHNRGWERALKPGEQAIFTSDGIEPIVSEVNVEQVSAWRNGLFAFQEDPIENVMRQIGAWYGVEIQYEGPQPEQAITGTIPRTTSLEETLNILQDTGSDARFRLAEGRIIVVKKN